MTSDKYADQYMVNNLLPDADYYFVVQSYTPAHDDQQNDLLSNYNNEVRSINLIYTFLELFGSEKKDCRSSS